MYHVSAQGVDERMIHVHYYYYYYYYYFSLPADFPVSKLQDFQLLMLFVCVCICADAVRRLHLGATDSEMRDEVTTWLTLSQAAGTTGRGRERKQKGLDRQKMEGERGGKKG